jgi:hypothetical protein
LRTPTNAWNKESVPARAKPELLTVKGRNQSRFEGISAVLRDVAAAAALRLGLGVGPSEGGRVRAWSGSPTATARGNGPDILVPAGRSPLDRELRNDPRAAY